MHKIWRQIVLTGGARLYSLICAFALMILSARWLGPAGHGIVATVFTWVTLLGTIGHLSLGQVVIHQAQYAKQNPDWLAHTLGSLLVVDVSATLIGWLVLIILWFIPGADVATLPLNAIVVGGLMLPFVIWEQYGSALLTSLQRLDIYNRAQILGRTIGIVVLGVAFWFNWGVIGVLLALLITQAVIALSGIYLLYTSIHGQLKFRLQELFLLVGNGLKLHINAIGAFLFTSANILIIHSYRGVTETGFYQLASQLFTGMLAIPFAASIVLYGNIAELGTKESWPMQRQVVFGVTLLMTIGAGLVAILAPWGINLIVGQVYTPAIQVLQILMIAVIGATLSQMMAPQWIGRGMFWTVSILTLSVGCLNVILNLLFVPKYGINGSAWAIVISYIVSIIPNVWMVLYSEKNMNRASDMPISRGV